MWMLCVWLALLDRTDGSNTLLISLRLNCKVLCFGTIKVTISESSLVLISIASGLIIIRVAATVNTGVRRRNYNMVIAVN